MERCVKAYISSNLNERLLEAMLKKHSHFGDSTAAKVEFVITIESLDFVDVMKYPGSMKVEWSRANSNGKVKEIK